MKMVVKASMMCIAQMRCPTENVRRNYLDYETGNYCAFHLRKRGKRKQNVCTR